MACPVVWPKIKTFYPIGDTPAVCLTSELPPEESADILLLGCGDGRNILYTVYADLGSPSRSLDFTCCDIDPAVLARNILLYTLLYDLKPDGNDEYLQKIWNFYYHFFIDEGTLGMVLRRCQVLVNLSSDIASWNNSNYGSFLRFSSLHSLATIREHWMLYIRTKHFSTDELNLLRAEFRKGADFTNYGAWRSAGPLWVQLPADIESKQYRHYRETGVTFVEPNKIANASKINPTFAYSAMQKGFVPSHDCEPIASFHLAKTLASITGSRNDEIVSLSDFFKGAVEEFKSWCLAFNKRVKERASLVIRFLVGDAIAICRALHCAANSSTDPGLYIGPWSSALMKLDGGDYADKVRGRAPVQFNVIDTSTLTDHIGLLNILVPCRPLMQTRPSSVIFTDTLVTSDDGIAPDSFFDSLCGDLPVLSIILDLLPVSFMSNFTSHYNVHEMKFLLNGSRKQFHKHVAWRIGSLSDSTAIRERVPSGQRLNFDEGQLAHFFHGVYQDMFSNDGLAPQNYPVIHHRRFTYAYILRFVKDRVDLNWENFINRLHDLIAHDRKRMRPRHIQDLFCSLHLLDVCRLSPDLNANLKEGPLKSWESVPPVVCITLEVPREAFDMLDIPSIKDIGTPVLLCSLKGPDATSRHIFQHFQCFWGEIKAKYDEDFSQEPVVTFEEDPEGFQGSSPAIFTFYVPACILGKGPQNVILGVQSNPGLAVILASIFGVAELDLSSTELTDRRYVHITRERPGNTGELKKLRNITFAQHTAEEMQASHHPVKITLDSANSQVALLTGRANIEDTNAKAALDNGATVSVNQISPRIVQISVRSYVQNIVYPFPVDSTDSRTRISMEPPYVELDVKISGPKDKLGMKLELFPVIQQNKVLSLWNVHYVDLRRLPALDLSDQPQFLLVHIRTSYSYHERSFCVTKSPSVPKEGLEVLTALKQCIHDIVLVGGGLAGEARGCSVIGLSDPENFGDYTLIFINAMRLDLASHTVVIDACVLPLTDDIMSRFSTAIERVGGATGFVRTITKPDEVKAWKHLLPVFTERCRRWSHTANCEYLSKGVPVSEEINESPLCSCGRGQDLGSFTKKKNWKELAPYVTRAAISPLFPAPFTDSIGADMINVFRVSLGICEEALCANCNGPGKPKLLLCGACKKASYCSELCQKANWKVHKKVCKKV